MSKIDEILKRGVVEFIDPSDSFRKKFEANPNNIIIKYGVDPTRPDIHLGHAACLRKLVEFRKLGCQVVFLIGDFTATIGDPTGKSSTRPEQEIEEIHKNMDTYIAQVKKVFGDQSIIKIQNSTWFMPFDDIWKRIYRKKSLPFFPDSAPELLEEYIRERRKWETDFNVARQFITLSNVIANLRKVTANQIIERKMFNERIGKGEPIHMNEFIYPVLQGVDSVVIAKWKGSCDLELGGTDQHFNMLMGRQIMERSDTDMIPQAVMTIKILEGTDGKEKMSKSLDNYIGITEEPNSMFGKVMSIPDTSMMNYFELCTNVPLEEAKVEIEKNPRDAKVRLAAEIVTMYHGEEAAEKAKEFFVNTFSRKEIPTDIPEVRVDTDTISLIDFIVFAGFAASKSDARRKIEQGGVEIDGERNNDIKAVLDKNSDGKVVKVGKINFAKIKIQ